MAQPTYAIQYLGTIRVAKNTEYLTADILGAFVGATVAKLSTDIPNDTVGIAINDTPMAHYHDDEEQYIVTGHKFIFNKDCTIKIGIYKAVV